ncbi:dinucleotide-utilizing enzyme [Microbacterium sp.]|uniref:dinucleotide-utilizing enzyme n=1 Tax=Microbacterium sp. TaxID=51671 RepID=UPI0039E50881
MTTSRLSRSIPFWGLVAGSVASVAGGTSLIIDKLVGMDARLTDGSATTSDVYVGQIWGVFGAILIGAGLVGLALALTVGALRSLSPRPAEVVEAPAWDDAADTDADDATDADAVDATDLADAADTDAADATDLADDAATDPVEAAVAESDAELEPAASAAR